MDNNFMDTGCSPVSWLDKVNVARTLLYETKREANKLEKIVERVDPTRDEVPQLVPKFARTWRNLCSKALENDMVISYV